jgi:L-cysteine:1D-myo-inositol 2-amino-2-deoxy-alpha-D-glucopyranoside ligase
VQIYSSLEKQKKPFIPLSEKKVLMYVCGITPYDTTHLGHAFLYIFFDVVKRYFEYLKYYVEYTQNVTDIDDDLLMRAKKDNINWKELGEMWTKKFLNDLIALNVLTPTNYIKATDSIPEIIEIVSHLQTHGNAYEADGTVYFDVSKFTPYGDLSCYSKEEMIELSKERGADPGDPKKKNKLDFILWQKSIGDEPSWDSPWGKGRPGWHIECSAMVHKTLGLQIDIHGGGFDLIYPHHESEIAQSESFTGKEPFVGYWMHAEMLRYEGEKMSKSLGNLVLVADLLFKHSQNAIRWMLLSHNYRYEWEYFDHMMDDAQNEVDAVLQKLETNLKFDENIKLLEEFEMHMNDDFNTPDVLAMIKNGSSDPKNSTTIRKIMKTLGFVIQ